MNGINLTVAGNLTRDPEFSQVSSGASLAKFSIAVERSFRSGDEWDKATSFVDVVCWKYLADDAARLLQKGMRVVVSGRLDQQSWEDRETGAKRSRFELTADELAISLRVLESVERKQRDDNPNGGGRPAPSRQPQPARRPAPAQSNDDIWDD
jgi:single-strand DNA-binding protein